MGHKFTHSKAHYDCCLIKKKICYRCIVFSFKVSTFIQVAMIDNFYIVHLFLLYTFPAYLHELFQSKVTYISKLRLILKFKNTTHNAREHKTEYSNLSYSFNDFNKYEININLL